MKSCYFFVVLVFCNLNIVGQHSFDFGQRIIRVQAKNEPPTEVIRFLEEELSFKFSYNADQLKRGRIVLVSDSMSLQEVIDSIFIMENPKIRQIGNQLVIYESAINRLSSDSCYQTIESQLIDELTGLPVPHASIRELRSDQMTVSNRDGKFRLIVSCDLPLYQLDISAIGYHSQYLENSLLQKLPIVMMKGDYITLQEVIILSIPAELLMEQVLNKVEENYLHLPTNATAFFREAILKNGKLIKMSEAVFDVYNQSYRSSHQSDQVKLVKGRRFATPNQNDTLDFKIKGSLKSCFDLDVVKNKPNFFNLDGCKMFDYNFEDVVVRNGHDIYVIGFKRKSLATGLPYEGRMFIDKERMALVSIDFELNKTNMRSVNENFVHKESKGTRTKLQNAQYHINYTDVQGKLVMNYARFETNFKVKKKKNLFPTNYETISEYVVNEFKTEEVEKIRLIDSFTLNRVFMDQPLDYNESYWYGINFLPIDQSLNEASEELQKILQEPLND